MERLEGREREKGRKAVDSSDGLLRAVHANVELLSVLVDVIAPHIVAEHDFLDHRYEVEGHKEANDGEEPTNQEFIPIVGAVL